jgi:GH35 family endo-1,4-beta-xylanase
MAMWRTAVIVLVSIFALPLASQSLPPTAAIPPEYFGLHIHHLGAGTAWPDITFKEWRLWDAGVKWRQLEPAKGDWHFELLDKYVQTASQHNVEILLTLGQTPTWASARPAELSNSVPGGAAEPANLQDWRDYVLTVATRYRGRVHQFEVWNEPDDRRQFSGTVGMMVEMTREAAEIIKKVDQNNILVSPSPTVAGVKWLDEYFAQGGAKYIDAVGFHFYATPRPPENLPTIISSVRRVMAAHGLSDKPLWDTESGWGKPKVFDSQAEMTAYLARAFILNWASGVSRLYWYAWDNYSWSTLRMFDPTTQHSTSAAKAYQIIESWLIGATVTSCSVGQNGTWMCALHRGASRSWIVWNPNSMDTSISPPSQQVQSVTSLSGESKKIKPTQVRVGMLPQLIQ